MGNPQKTIALLLLLTSCSGSNRTTISQAQSLAHPQFSSSTVPGSELSPTSRAELYRNAIRDAVNPEPAEIYRNLTRLTGNPNLIDSVVNGQWHILVVVWTAHPDRFPDSGPAITGDRGLWVTVAPQLQARCRSYSSLFGSGDGLRLRLQQLLGLPADDRDRHFLEFWVRPSDLFRPCPDNETDDTECGLNIPAGADSSYRAWFNRMRAIAYSDCPGSDPEHAEAIWTQLGYTYDWNPENSGHVGLSEFVVKPQSPVWVRGEIETDKYGPADL